MGQVRWASWTVTVATALVITSGQVARADVASDKSAAIVIYPEVKVDSSHDLDTVIRLTNTSNAPIALHCFYLDANSHCVGGTAEGKVCTSGVTSGSSVCTGGGTCSAVSSLQEIDFDVTMTPKQPLQWLASEGLSPPIPNGVCSTNPFVPCNTNDDCSLFANGSTCTPSNSGTNVPGTPEDPFVGELKCIEVNPNSNDVVPIAANDVKGEALIEQSTPTKPDFDVASYNAVGIEALLQCSGGTNDGGPCKSNADCQPPTGSPGTCQAPSGPIGNVLTLGGNGAEYNGCPNYLILNHFFDFATDPVPGSSNTITTNLVLVPCSEDLESQICGEAVLQFLVFNEFESRFSTSVTADCFLDKQLSKLTIGDPTKSIWSVSVEGTLTGQTRINPVVNSAFPLPSGMVGFAYETHTGSNTRSAAFNLHLAGVRADKSGNPLSDTITLP